MKRRGEVWLVWVEGERETKNEKKRGREDDEESETLSMTVRST